MRIVTLAVLGLGLALGGCSSKSEKHASMDPFAGVGSPYYHGKGKIPVGGGKYHVGNPYQVAGRWFTPKEQPNYDKVGMSSWYGEAFHRRRTSNGEYFDMDQLTAAHATLPLPSYARVTNLSNGRSVVVRINDRGPFVGTRIVDVSKRAAEMLDYKRKGTERVRLQYIGPAPLNDPGGRDLIAMNEGSGAGRASSDMLAQAELKQPTFQRQRKIRQPVMQASFEPPADDSAGMYGSARPSDAYYVDLGSYADPDNVQRIREGMSGAGPVQVSEIDGANGPVYRLRLGPMSSSEDAKTAYNEAVGFGIPDARIIHSAVQQAALR